MELLFDLDGTLTNSQSGITRCLQHAMLRMGYPAPPVTELRRFIGPPLRGTFRILLETDDAELIDTAIEHYRERFASTGLYENEVYLDVPSALASLRDDGHRLWVVTSKAEVYARRIVEHFELGSFFEKVYGSDLSGARVDKVDLVAHLLERESMDPAHGCIIGDRALDIAAGQAHGLATIGALWGYGSEQELVDARADHLVDSMAALCMTVDTLSSGRSGHRRSALEA